MRRGKEEEKISSSPMFPRLHVNDADKGGPRAPPRNKMALYEQLSTPSQRFNSSSLPPQSGRNLGPQGVGHEGNVFSPVYAAPSAPAYSVEEVNPRSFDGENMRTSEGEFERRSSRHLNFNSANAVGSVTECSALHQRGSNMNSCQKRVDDDDGDFMVPTFVNSENALYRNKDTTGEKKRLTILQANSAQNVCHATFNSSVQLPSSLDVPLEQTSTSDAKSGKPERKCNEENLIDAVVMEVHAEKNLSQPEAGEKPAESSRLVKSTSDLEHAVSRCIRQESCGNGALDGPIARSESQSKASHGHRSMNVDVICNRTSYDKENRSLGQNDADKNDEMSDTSMVDSVSGLEISPDDVVGVIGPKQFWKARRAIVNQQRVFAVQVFELHRLIKVQKLLAASPHLLLEENFCATPQKVPIKNLPIEPYSKSQSQTVKQKDDSQKPNQNTDYRFTESTGVAPLSAHNDVLNKVAGESPRCAEPYSGNTHPVPPASENRSNPWCFQPPAHQWLVPVMSPSEGLIYKPYAGPCPPTTGFTAPVYGNYSPMSLPPGYTVPPCPQQNMGVLSGAPPIAPNYLPTPYGLPAMNPMISNSAVEQMSPMAGPRPNLQTEQNSRSSCNMSFPKSDAFTGRPWKAHASKDSELQGSTASSPCERAQGEGRDALPLFPMAPTAEASAQPSESNSKEHQTRVIRVVPHNARSATESAARIFRSIQEERQQLDQ